ncbi:MAG: M48 family metallopeptidase [Deltaproteobacteria bacterium]|nr:M48 family metallopeptidase [Deltaproteobacteria bacterium]
MEYSNPPIPEGINSPDRHPLRDFFLKGGMAVGIFVGCLIGIGWLASLLVPWTPFSWEERAARGMFPEDAQGQQEQELRRLAERVAAVMELPEGMHVTVHYDEGATVNAFAMAGGHIVVYRGILKRLESENELTMLLAHEIAHVKNRDVARSVLRGLGIMLLMAGIEPVGPVLNGVGQMGTLSFSRKQEGRADREATAAMAKLYGHTGGAVELFTHLRAAAYGKGRETPEIVSSHPDFAHRIARIRKQSQELGCPTEGKLTPLPVILEKLKKEKVVKQ